MKYYEKSLDNIVKTLGRLVKVDQATKNKDKLFFARVMVEVRMNQSFYETIQFVNERDEVVEQKVEYEWLLISCSLCKRVGHEERQCMKKVGATKKKWVPKVLLLVEPREKVVDDPKDGFVQAAKFSKPQITQLRPIITISSIR